MTLWHLICNDETEKCKSYIDPLANNFNDEIYLFTQNLCECIKDFHGNGTYCVPNDPCTVNKGNCHRKVSIL